MFLLTSPLQISSQEPGSTITAGGLGALIMSGRQQVVGEILDKVERSQSTEVLKREQNNPLW